MPSQPLTAGQIEEARGFLLENAVQLINEAEALRDLGAYARAYALAHLACEELFKIPMLVRAAIESQAKGYDWATLHRRLRDHRAKIRGTSILDFLLDEDVHEDGDIIRLKARVAATHALSRAKNDALYVSVGAGEVQCPTDRFDDAQASAMIAMAKAHASFIQAAERATQGSVSSRQDMQPIMDLVKDQGPEFLLSLSKVLFQRMNRFSDRLREPNADD